MIGRLGGSGAVTGPHLHFGMYRNGQYINALNASLPTAASLPENKKPDFIKRIGFIDNLFENENIAEMTLNPVNQSTLLQLN